MNGDVFRGLHKLKNVYLHSNQCIKDNFITESAIEKLPEIVSKNCGFCEKISDLTNCEVRREFREALNIVQKLRGEQSYKVEVARLVEKLSACVKIQRFHEKLEKQLEATCAAKTENLETIMSLKAKENAKLYSENEMLKSENNDKKNEIKKLKEKLAMFESNLE